MAARTFNAPPPDRNASNPYAYDARPDTRRPVTRVFRRVMLISRFFDNVIDQTARKNGLSRGEFLALMTLMRAGPRRALRPTELVRLLLVTSGAITKQIDRLARCGLVERLDDRSDRRSSPVRLTDRGRAIAQAVRRQRTAMSDVADRLGARDLQALDRMLARYLDAVKRGR